VVAVIGFTTSCDLNFRFWLWFWQVVDAWFAFDFAAQAQPVTHPPFNSALMLALALPVTANTLLTHVA
jgi:hypothetical protein